MDLIQAVRQQVQSGLRAAVDRLPSPVRGPVGYHMGWWDKDGVRSDHETGKLIRPMLVMLSADAVGPTMECALPAAVAVELVHNFSLLHDDVIDEDTMRRNRPTVWSVFGTPTAILGGDALLVLALQVLFEALSPMTQAGSLRLQDAVQEMISGQVADLEFERRADVRLDECVNMAAAKTASLIECACGLGALFGGADDGRVRRLRGFGRQIGIAFQLIDDILNIWGESEVVGKPTSSDLRRRKKSLPVVAALTADNAAGRHLGELYLGTEPLDEAEVRRVADLIEEAGGRLWAEQEAERRFDAALSHLDSADIRSEQLLTLAESLIKRNS